MVRRSPAEARDEPGRRRCAGRPRDAGRRGHRRRGRRARREPDRTITTSSGAELSGLVQTDAAISSGDSRGPLLTPAGAVIGINTAGAASTEGVIVTNIGFAIPINQAMPVLRELSR